MENTETETKLMEALTDIEVWQNRQHTVVNAELALKCLKDPSLKHVLFLASGYANSDELDDELKHAVGCWLAELKNDKEASDEEGEE